MVNASPTVLMFAPETWGQADTFRRFYQTTYTFTNRQQRAVIGIEAHFQKFINLLELAKKLMPNLAIDAEELERQGYSPARNSAEIVTVIEASVLELHSVIDCLVQVLHAIFGKGTKGFKESTRGMFANAHKFTGTFPDELKLLFTDVDWYNNLLFLRDDLTHLDTGSVHLSRETQKLQYMHTGMKVGDKVFIVEDIFIWLDEKAKKINELLGKVFYFLNGTLNDNWNHQFCGTVEGRFLHRWIQWSRQITFNSGKCGAWIWFEKPENPTCPFKDFCGAYLDKAPPEGLATAKLV